MTNTWTANSERVTLKVTPAHDVNDYDLGQKHNLESINIFHPDGTLNEHGEPSRARWFDVRKEVEGV